ncbi:DHHA1 domain-containing protein [Pseudanabaena sp. ABRG5-3]|uniref:DHHA1 domain-containing protein n=1 Tax=Pseudanabaena sp. ABRG5-3 TaxID=685565 RepID=UPI000DC712BD|nr:DHHA1 domain-containing protein [Pseudanabaena sp. ABRG5-3]BBC23238.1 single-stranded-DNA-specific exonuclease [Pseudanabaena sp. ABRG5-3]
MEIQSANFSFLREHDPQLVNLAARAEQYCHSDSNTCIIKLRQFAERLAQHIADQTEHYQAEDEAQIDLLRRLEAEGVISREVAKLFHNIRKGGNNAAHTVKDDRREALALLKNAHELGNWFHSEFGNDSNFRPRPFVPPAAPTDPTTELQAEIDRLIKTVNETEADKIDAIAELNDEIKRLKDIVAKLGKKRPKKRVIKSKQKLEKKIPEQPPIATPEIPVDIPEQPLIAAPNITPSAEGKKALTPSPSPNEREGSKKKKSKREGWHHGVIGIVASRLVERYGAPVFIGSYEDADDHDAAEPYIRFSVRGIPEFHVFQAIEYEPIKSIRLKGGGHKAAGGFTMPAANLEKLRQGLREFADHENILPSHISPLINIDVRIDLSDVSMTLLQECDRLQPCGLGNPDPVFYSENVRVISQQTRGKDKVKHLSLELDTGNGKIKAIAWRWGEYCPIPDRVDIAYKLRANQWQDTTSVELEIVGIREASDVVKSSPNPPKQILLQYKTAPVITKFPQWQKLNEAPRPLPRPLLLYGHDRPADKFQGDVDCDRPIRDRDYQAVVLWTLPPSFTHLQWLIAIAKPDYIYLGSHIPSVPSIEEFRSQIQSLDIDNINVLNLLDLAQQWWISPSAIISALRELGYICDFPATLPLEGELLRMQKWYSIAINKITSLLEHNI